MVENLLSLQTGKLPTQRLQSLNRLHYRTVQILTYSLFNKEKELAHLLWTCIEINIELECVMFDHSCIFHPCFRDFAYVARDKNTRVLKCHVFRCDTPAAAIATSLHEICSKVGVTAASASTQISYLVHQHLMSADKPKEQNLFLVVHLDRAAFHLCSNTLTCMWHNSNRTENLMVQNYFLHGAMREVRHWNAFIMRWGDKIQFTKNMR